MTILLAEDDRDFGNILAQYLMLGGYVAKLTYNGQEAWEAFIENQPDICIFDITMPEMDGFTLAKKIKLISPFTPFIFLTARDSKQDIIRGLRMGAADYITKPIVPEILLLKINNILNRLDGDEIKVANSILKFSSLDLVSGDTNIKLTLKEAILLKFFMQNKNKLLTREDILREVWGEKSYFLGRSMDVFISRLRKYLANDGRIDIITIRGSGFILEEKPLKTQ